jgi:hypothetical protein
VEAASKKGNENVKLPEPISGNLGERQSFYKILVKYLSSKNRKSTAPLGYVIRTYSEGADSTGACEPLTKNSL